MSDYICQLPEPSKPGLAPVVGSGMDYIRINRRTYNEHTQGYSTYNGPWHAMLDGGLHQTWCGRKMRGAVMQHLRAQDTPPEGELCPTCVRAIALARPKAFRKR